MANPARIPASRPMFVTATTYNGHPIFQVSSLAERFIHTLQALRTRGHFKLHAYLILPDRIHLVLTPRTLPLQDTLALIQSTFAEQLEIPFPIWQPGFTAQPILSIQDLEKVRAHLHQAPVRANLVPSAQLYPYSSARGPV